jgi:hypothetical protein
MPNPNSVGDTVAARVRLSDERNILPSSSLPTVFLTMYLTMYWGV